MPEFIVILSSESVRGTFVWNVDDNMKRSELLSAICVCSALVSAGPTDDWCSGIGLVRGHDAVHTKIGMRVFIS